MGYDAYVRFCKTVTTTEELYRMLADHNDNIINAPTEQGAEAWRRMQRIVRSEILRRVEGGKVVKVNEDATV